MTAGPSCPARRQDGYATVWAVAWMLVLGTVASVAVLAAVAVARQHRLDGAADLAALSGARALQDGLDGCAESVQVAAANDVDVGSCEVVDDDVLLTVRDTLDLPLGVHVVIVGRARAGPG